MSVYEKITSNIVSAIESGAATGNGWKMPWHNAQGLPQNFTTRRAYKGVNVVNLWIEASDRGFNSGEWGTFKQWQGAGAKVKKGERGSLVVF